MTPIKNYGLYNSTMKRSMYDKLFFVDKIKPSMIVDFGCADGQLLNELQPYYPNAIMLGVDNDSVMRDTAKDNYGINVHKSLEDIEPCESGSAIILSSVLHELYSYSTGNDIKRFWDLVSQYEYIVIRDMAISMNAIATCVPHSDHNVVRCVLPSQVEEFEAIWGGIQRTENLIHFLLKYMYVENWKREVKENYLSNSVDALRNKVLSYGDIIYQDHRVLPYLKDKWHKDFGITVNTPTHFKCIVKTHT